MAKVKNLSRKGNPWDVEISVHITDKNGETCSTEIYGGHAQILAENSEYFRTLLYGPFLESTNKITQIFVMENEKPALDLIFSLLYNLHFDIKNFEVMCLINAIRLNSFFQIDSINSIIINSLIIKIL
jgi:hypothetical protein